MLTSLLHLIRNALRLLSRGARATPTAVPRQEPVMDIEKLDPRPLVQGFEMEYWRDSDEGLRSQRLWVRVDTRELMQRLCNNPDINLDALSDDGPPTRPDIKLSDWHRKVRSVTQNPPTRH